MKKERNFLQGRSFPMKMKKYLLFALCAAFALAFGLTVANAAPDACAICHYETDVVMLAPEAALGQQAISISAARTTKEISCAATKVAPEVSELAAPAAVTKGYEVRGATFLAFTIVDDSQIPKVAHIGQEQTGGMTGIHSDKAIDANLAVTAFTWTGDESMPQPASYAISRTQMVSGGSGIANFAGGMAGHYQAEDAFPAAISVAVYKAIVAGTGTFALIC